MYKVRATYLPRPGMTFNLDYYFRVHVPLAQQQAAGRLNIVKLEIESGATALMNPDQALAPCVFCIYFKGLEDVETFRRFMAGPGTDPMRADVPRYTNCELEWSVCEVREV
jgi:hypothetical protein